MAVRWIAEVSSNHNGDLDRARTLVQKAAEAGFWGVKFQDFRISRMFHESALAESQGLRDRKAREVPVEWHEILSTRAHSLGIAYGLSVFSEWDVFPRLRFVDFWKVSSYDLLRHHLIQKLRWRPLIISTGMATMEECLDARHTALFANQDVTFLHCVSSYPTPREQANLGAIDAMQKRLCVPIGWSDHTRDREVVRRAVWRWRASTVELHIDLDDEQGMDGPPHSWPISTAAEMIRELSRTGLPDYLPRESEIDGNGVKAPQPCEEKERLWRADPSDGMRPMQAARTQPSERT